MSPILAAREALERLRAGNQRFVAGRRFDESVSDLDRRADLVAAQEPFAIILGCSDSRVPAELVFDQGLGDLFVIRVAGNVIAPSQIGSVEFAVETFGTRVAVVLGHSNCGAVETSRVKSQRSLADVSRGSGERPTTKRAILQRRRSIVAPVGRRRRSLSSETDSTTNRNLRSIIDEARPSAAVESLLLGRDDIDPATLLDEAVRANVRLSTEQLRHGSSVIEGKVSSGHLLIVGAEYSLETGVVDFFEEAAPPTP